MYDLNCKNNRKAREGGLFAPSIFSLCAFLCARREVYFGEKDRKSVPIKLAGKNFTAL